MDEKLQIGQVVWAKVRGYAWWPGVVRLTQVSEIKQEEDSDEEIQSAKITVQFIGENTHSILPRDKVVDYQNNYDKYSKTNQKVKSTQWLKKCIEVADKVLSREIDLKDLPYYNEKLRNSYVKRKEENKQVYTRTKRRERSQASSVESDEELPYYNPIPLHSVPDYKIKDLDKSLLTRIKSSPSHMVSSSRLQSQAVIKSNILSSQKLIYGFIHHFAPQEIKPEKLTIENLYECIKELIQLDISPQHLESSKLMRLVKLFKEEFIDSKNLVLQNLAKTAHKLYLYWKRSLIGYQLDKLAKESDEIVVHVIEDEPDEYQPIIKATACVETQPRVPKKRGRPAKKKVQSTPEEPSKLIKLTPKYETVASAYKVPDIEEVKSEETVESEPKNDNSIPDIREFTESISPLQEIKLYENKELRKSLLRKIAKILQKKGLTKQVSRDRAMNIDKEIREIDGNFGDRYISLLQKFKRYMEKLPNLSEKDPRFDIESLARQFYIQD